MNDKHRQPVNPDYLKEGSTGLHRKLHRMASMLNVAIGMFVFAGFMLLENVLSWQGVLVGLVLMLGGLPIVGFVMPRIHRRFEKELFQLLEEGPDSLSKDDLDKARHSLITIPWRGAAATVFVWTVLIPPVLSWLATTSGTTSRYSLVEIYIAAVTVAPLMALTVLFAFELVLRPYVSALFPQGGVERFHSRFALTIRKKLLFSILLIGPYCAGLIAFLSYRRMATSGGVLPTTLSELATLETFLILISLGIVVVLVFYIRQGIDKPVQRLVDALHAVAQGELNTEIKVESFDAFGVMADRFNHMVEGLREKERLSKENADLAFQLGLRAKDLETLTMLYEDASTQARTDALTKLYNRRAFEELVVQNFFEYKRYRYPFCIMMVDIDHFKSINDRFGHAAGDMVIQAVAEVFKKTVRIADICARWGGEEFIIALPNSDIEQACILAERIRKNVEAIELNNIDGTPLPTITVSLGASESKGDDINLERVIERADQALYSAKTSGRNRVKTSGAVH